MADLYFAYGSNLHGDDRRAWCVRNEAADFVEEEVGSAWLPDRRLVFDYHSSSRGGGALNLAAAVGHVVEGRLFRLRRGGWSALDRKEGAAGDGGRYRRIAVSVFDAAGRRAHAATYEVTDARREDRFVAPQPEYVDLVGEGLLSVGLSRAPLEEAARGLCPRSLVEGVFIYGTLLPGEPRHPWLAAAHDGVGAFHPASVPGLLVDLGVYPALVPAFPGSGSRVVGAFVPVDEPDRLVRELDEVEAFYGYQDPDSLYHRAPIRAALGSGGHVLAWTYLMPSPPPGAFPIPSGSWLARR